MNLLYVLLAFIVIDFGYNIYAITSMSNNINSQKTYKGIDGKEIYMSKRTLLKDSLQILWFVFVIVGSVYILANCPFPTFLLSKIAIVIYFVINIILACLAFFAFIFNIVNNNYPFDLPIDEGAIMLAKFVLAFNILLMLLYSLSFII